MKMRSCIAGRVCVPRTWQKPTRTSPGRMSSAEWVGTATDGIGTRGLALKIPFRATESSTARSAGDSIRQALRMRHRSSMAATTIATSGTTLMLGALGGTMALLVATAAEHTMQQVPTWVTALTEARQRLGLRAAASMGVRGAMAAGATEA